jgi:predicted aldo/keto reductase-like oxidoreductase
MLKEFNMERRTFLKMTGGVAGGCLLGAGAPLFAASTGGEKAADMPRRTLGKTGLQISVIAFPGLSLSRASQEDATKAVRKALDQGVNYFDVAPAYGDAEVKLGVALQGIDRSKYVLSCKTNRRDKQTAQQELDRSLQRLKTDHFDVYQMHHLRTREEVKQALAPGGVMEVFVEAKKQGKTRYLGITSHTTRGALEAINGFDFDTVLFPINFIEYYQFGMGKEVLEAAKKKNMGVMGMKTMCGGSWPQGMTHNRDNWYRAVEEQETINLAVRWTLSQEPVTTAIAPGFIDLFEKAIPVGRSFSPITEAEAKKLQELAKSYVSLFHEEEQGVAMDHPAYFDHLHGGCPHSMA